ncbi:probable ubiquitin-conjugating enzyme E2 23 [Salvia splendens]|uniref:probable ubiquitin-conjugating enzyme E2 23 n=1 Tax=Salvia splendens TaxID=180675 RepID=UPI001C25FCB4|nr:probable ubiquitin-conjugating enzyme E2 23 [Salvia splendens]
MESEQKSGILDANNDYKATSEESNSSSCGRSGDQNMSYDNKPGEILQNLQNVSYIYRQDVVRCKSKTQIGIVTEVAGDSDSDSDSDSSITDDEDEDEDGGGVDNEKDDEAGSNEEGDLENDENSGENAVDSNESNDSKNNPLTADQVRVLWMDGAATTETTTDVEVIDRGFLHGDYVAAASDPTGQIGIVVDVNINVDLLTHDGSVIKDKASRDLMRIRDFTIGDHVVLGPWLGRIEDVFDNVTVQFDDGSVCKVMKADPLHLKPVGKNILEDGHFPYYPGQRVQSSSSSVFKNSRWLSGSWKANKVQGTVINVTVGSVFIYWIASAGYGPDSDTTPAEEQSPKNLKLLSCFAHTNWQLGDWCLLPFSKESTVTTLNKGSNKADSHDSTKGEHEFTGTVDDSDAEMATTEQSSENNKSIGNDLVASSVQNCETSKENKTSAEDSGNSSVPASKEVLHRKKLRKVVVRKDKKSRKKLENFERALLICNTSTKVDVVWQDGKIKCDLDSTSLIPIDSPGDHEFVAEQYVVEKAADSDDAVETRRVGVIKSVDAKDRTACVRWLKPVARAEDPREFDKEEMVSVYELEGHPDYDYCYGDVVVRLSPISLPDQMDSLVHSVENMALTHPDELKQENGEHYGCGSTETTLIHDESTEFADLSWVGNITGLRDGDIEVTWADGMISTVGPQAIYVVGRDDDESIAGGSDGDDAASWETVEDDTDNVNDPEDHGMENAVDSRPEIEDETINAENSGKNGALSLPLAAIGFMTRLASGIFSRGQKNSDPSEIDIQNEDVLQPEAKDHDGGSSSHKQHDIDERLAKLTKCEEEDHEAAEASDLLEIAETLCNLKPPESNASAREEFISTFKGFDIVRDPLDHNFLGSQNQNNSARKWLKKVQQDWDILQNNLPEGIYVRVYEDRMDLLRAVIVGAYGTPYQDGLFFFDFHLPPEYPDVPPSAYYHSGGWRINPNLYEEGKVCLSLLNTWTGRGNEVWDPSTSSILQVLVSLQGLVLNAKPYFNEAGYDKQVGTAEGEKNSLSYNENTFLLNCKMMMYLMRRPPKDFEELVVEHFRKRGSYILKACDAYMKGNLIGSLAKDASASDSITNSNSVGFKLMLAKVLPKLVSALNDVGAECQEFEHLAQS